MSQERIDKTGFEPYVQDLMSLDESALVSQFFDELDAWAIHSRKDISTRTGTSGRNQLITPNWKDIRSAIVVRDNVRDLLISCASSEKTDLNMRLEALEKLLSYLVPEDVFEILNRSMEEIRWKLVEEKIVSGNFSTGLAVAVVGSIGIGGTFLRKGTGVNLKADLDILRLENNESSETIKIELTKILEQDLEESDEVRGLCGVYNGRGYGVRNIESEEDIYQVLKNISNLSIEDKANLLRQFDVYFTMSFPNFINERNRRFFLAAMQRLANENINSWKKVINLIVSVSRFDPVKVKYISPWKEFDADNILEGSIDSLVKKINGDFTKSEFLKIAEISLLGRNIYNLFILKLLLATGNNS